MEEEQRKGNSSAEAGAVRIRVSLGGTRIFPPPAPIHACKASYTLVHFYSSSSSRPRPRVRLPASLCACVYIQGDTGSGGVTRKTGNSV